MYVRHKCSLTLFVCLIECVYYCFYFCLLLPPDGKSVLLPVAICVCAFFVNVLVCWAIYDCLIRCYGHPSKVILFLFACSTWWPVCLPARGCLFRCIVVCLFCGSLFVCSTWWPVCSAARGWPPTFHWLANGKLVSSPWQEQNCLLPHAACVFVYVLVQPDGQCVLLPGAVCLGCLIVCFWGSLFVCPFHLIVRVFSCQGLATSLPFAGAGWSGQADQTEGRRSKKGPSIPLELFIRFKMLPIVDMPGILCPYLLW